MWDSEQYPLYILSFIRGRYRYITPSRSVSDQVNSGVQLVHNTWLVALFTVFPMTSTLPLSGPNTSQPSVIHFERPYLRLTYDGPNQWLHADWQGELRLEQVREGAEKVLVLIREYGYTKLLNDNSHVTALHLTSEEQAGYQIMESLFAAGLHYLAWVYAPVAQGREYAELSVAATKWPLLLTFEEVRPAADWLRRAL